MEEETREDGMLQEWIVAVAGWLGVSGPDVDR